MGDTAAVFDISICLRVDGAEQRIGDQVGGLNDSQIWLERRLPERRRNHSLMEATGNTPNRETNEPPGHDNHPSICDLQHKAPASGRG